MLIFQSPIDLRSLSPHCLRRRRHGLRIVRFRVSTKAHSLRRAFSSHRSNASAGTLDLYARTVAGGESLLSAVVAASGNYPDSSELVFIARP